MEIHPPHQPVLTVKEALVHLGIVTIGILIALSLEGLVEWQHHRHLVAEARENIAEEIRDNSGELKHFLGSVAQIGRDAIQATEIYRRRASSSCAELRLNETRLFEAGSESGKLENSGDDGRAGADGLRRGEAVRGCLCPSGRVLTLTVGHASIR